MAREIYQLGRQVVYVPDHVRPDSQEGIEYGFVTRDAGLDAIWVRYWRMPLARPPALRTTANSELTPLRCLEPFKCTRAENVVLAVRAHITGLRMVLAYVWQEADK